MKKGLRRVAAVAVTTLVVAPALATTASATSTFAFDRLAGANRYDTSVAVAGEYGNSTNVILASGVPGHYPDALTASYLAGKKNAPIMLTQLAATPTNVMARIAASGATDVWLVGGEGVISAAQATALDVLYTVHRLGGLDRYLTAKAVIGDAGTATSTTAILATGKNFPDAIAGGPLSYVKGMPLAITEANTLPPATLTALQAAGVTKVIVLGGPTIITANVLSALAAGGITLDQRIFGANRSETSSMLADYLLTSQGFSNTGVNVASGYAFGTGADALGGAPLSGKENRPTLITENVTNVGPGPLGYLTAHSATLAKGHIFGGLGAVSQPSEDAMVAAARGTAAAGPITFTSATVAQGGSLAGTVANPGSVQNIAVAGCGINNANVAVSGTGTFSLLVPASQAVGSCDLVFTITNVDGTTSTQTVPITVTATPRGVTAAPDLVSVAMAGNVVTYTFDAPIGVVDTNLANSSFHIYGANGNESNPLEITSSGSTVTARYAAGEVALATTATVDHGAVSGATGLQSPVNALPLQSITLAMGKTDAPDLTSVSLGTPTVPAGITRFVFVFDAPITTLGGPGKFVVVSTDGTRDVGTNAVISGVDNRQVTVQFATLPVGIPAGSVVRGVALANAVSDGLSNPQEAATVGTSNITTGPDLVGVAVSGANVVRFTFDQPVLCTNKLKFQVYNAVGTEVKGDDCTPVNANLFAVDVSFANSVGAVANAVGANILPGAVTRTTGTLPYQANEVDELGLQSVTYQAGRTAKADLVSVTQVTSVFGVTTVKYTFDDPIVLPGLEVLDGAQFSLYDAAGARFQATTAPALSANGRTVTVTNGFTAAQLTAAIIGGVDYNPGADVAAVPPAPAFPEGAATVTAG